MNIAVLDFERWDSGITAYALAAAEGLKNKGHNVIFAGLESKAPATASEKLGIKTLGLSSAVSLFALMKIIRKENIDCLNPHDGKSHLLCAMAKTLTRERPRLVRTYADARPVRKHALTWQATDFFIAAAEFIKADFLNKGLPPGKISVIYQGLDKNFYGKADPAKLAGKYNVSIVGRLDPVKGHETFIRAAALVSKIIPEAFFYVIGGEKNVKISLLKNLADQSGLKNIVFTGFVENAASYMRASDAGVIASSGSEAVSRAAAEWMACAKPLVSTRAGCLGELVEDGRSGLLVAPGDHAAMASAIERLLKNAEERLSMGRAAAGRAEAMFDPGKFASDTEKVLRGDL